MPEVQTPVTRMTRPVMEQTTRVSMKVWVMEMRACTTGWLVRAATAAMGAEPRPDSLENRPRATPRRMAIITVAPAKPPVAATGWKALDTTMARTPGISVMCMRITARAPST